MKKLLFKRGFTLVELLIVIAIIGILAIALMAAIDPLEQLRKSRDTGRLADAKELLGAFERYYTSQGCYPWEKVGTGSCPSGGVAMATSYADWQPNVSVLVSLGEIKANFSNRAIVSKREGWATKDSGDQVHVCFKPESKNGRNLGFGSLYNPQGTANVTSSCSTGTYNGSSIESSCNVCIP